MTRFLLLILFASSSPIAGWCQTKEVVKEVNDKLDSLRSEDDQLRAILSNHPSVAAAKAKVMLAQAELDQIRLELTTKVTSARADLKLLEQSLDQGMQRLVRAEQMSKQGLSSSDEVSRIREQVTIYQTQLLRAKARLQELTLSEANSKWWLEKTPANFSIPLHSNDANPSNRSAVSGSTASINPPLSVAVKKTVKMEANGLAPDLLDQLLKQAGFTGQVRHGPITKNFLKDETLLVSLRGELSVSGWVDLILDDVNSRLGNNGPFECYVREYGLLIAERKKAPADAMTLRDFTRAVHNETSKK